MSVDWQKVSESKQAYRRKLAALPIAEKLRLLDAMRERAVTLRSVTLPKRAPKVPGGAVR